MKRTIHSYVGDCLDCPHDEHRRLEFRSSTEAKVWKIVHKLLHPTHRVNVGQQWREVSAETLAGPEDSENE